MNETFAIWNACAQMSRPRLKEFLERSGWPEPKRVFSHSDILWLFGENLLAQLDFVRSKTSLSDALVGRMLLIVTSTYFAEDALVTTTDLPPFAMLSAMLPSSAQSVLSRLKSHDPHGFSVQVESDRVRIVHRTWTELSFAPLVGPKIEDLERTRLISVALAFHERRQGPAPVITAHG